MIWIKEAARIFGVSAYTLREKRKRGAYRDIRTINTPKGVMFHIFDVFKIAHPTLNNRQIEELILDYRIKMTMTKKQSKKRGGNC